MSVCVSAIGIRLRAGMGRGCAREVAKAGAAVAPNMNRSLSSTLEYPYRGRKTLWSMDELRDGSTGSSIIGDQT